MVAELAGISQTTTKQKTSSDNNNSSGIVIGKDSSNFDKSIKTRPKWIQTATREPIYSVLDVENDEKNHRQHHCRFKDNVVLITAYKSSADCPKKFPSEERLPPEGKFHSEEEEEESNPLYSVITKKGSNPQPEVTSRQEELRKWLQIASNQIPMSRFNFDQSKMYSQEGDENSKDGRKRPISSPRGVVGLVGPYRVTHNLAERREYILQEEELIEENGEFVNDLHESEIIRERGEIHGNNNHNNNNGNNNYQEEHKRAKWRIRDEDEETLVPDLMVRNFLDAGVVDDDSEIKDDVVQEVADKVQVWKQLEMRNAPGPVVGIIIGKEERAVDVPEAMERITKSSNVSASNEQHDKDSLNETGSTTGGTVEGAPGGNPGRGERSKETEPPAQEPSSSAIPPRSLVSRILSRARSPEDLLDHSEPFSQLWIVLSNVYGELVVIMMMALCLAEVMDTPVPLLSLQGIFLMYMYIGSIVVIISIYLWVLIDSCRSFGSSGIGIDDAELGGASLTRFGSLKRAHISRSRTTTTSFYIRVGALLFGLATLVFNGLEMAMHSMMQGTSCLSDIIFVHPVLHGLFTFLQMHFLFVNSQVLVERFGLAARFGFTHLAATNVAVWIRLIIWDSALEWTYFVHLAQRGPQTSSSPLHLRGFPQSLTRHSRDVLGQGLTGDNMYKIYEPISKEQISQVVALQDCLNGSSLGQLWTSSLPFLYPFIVQFSLIAAAVTFVMGQNVGRNRLSHKHKFHSIKDLTIHNRAGCDGSSKGLFLGILCMVAGIVVILIFLVVREDENFPPSTLSWLTCGTLIAILSLSGLMTASGLVQIRQMSVVSRAPAALDTLLSNVSLFGIQLYSVFTIIVCVCCLNWTDDEESQGRHIMLLSASVLQLLQSYAQSTLMAEASKRSCITRYQMMAKPARQVITFLLFSNAVLWAFDTVIIHNWISQELQLRFFGVLAWGIISRIGLPLLIFYRFHSCVLLLEVWNKCYRTPRGEHPLN